MQETEQLITLYHTGFIICLILTILFAVLSVLIFFLFKIRRVFDFLTGRAEKRTIRQMEEENAQTGKLRRDTFIPESTGDLYKTPSGSIPPIIYPPTGEVATGGETTEKIYSNGLQEQSHVQLQRGGNQYSGIGSVSGTGNASREDESTEILPEGSEETTLLQDEGSEETTLLSGSADETTVPLYGAQGETMLLTPELEKAMREEREKKAYSGRFEIIKETMLVHTEERI